jgi:signal transduction histidine kinase
MTFRNKILFSIWGVVLGLLIITFFIINYWTRGRMEESFTTELRTSFSSVSVHEKLQSAQLIRACVVIAESPRLRAVAELGDAKTAYQLLQELNRTTLSQLFVLTDRDGRPLVQLLRGNKDQWDIANAGTITSALHFVAATDIWAIRGVVYRIVSVPILIENELVGTLTIGFEITRNDIATLKRATNTDLLLINNGSAVLSTLDSAEAGALLPAILPLEQRALDTRGDTVVTAMELSTRDETYLGTAFRLHRAGSGDSSDVFYLMIKPLSREVRKTMASILATFGLVSLAFLVITTAIGLVISRSMTRPIRELVTGTTEIGKGNYDYPIEVKGRDEMSVLAHRFMEMSASLKDKISQLGKLNQDLLERNRALDETLRQLQSAQHELVRSERLAATGKMTAQLAHEINNPIHNIQSCLQTALGRLPADIKGRDLINVAFDEVERLSRLTAQMLNLYRSSLVEDEMSPTDLNNLLDEIVVITRDELAGNKIRSNQNIPAGLPKIRGSKDKLKQVFLNLIANARDAMPEGGELSIAAAASNGTIRVAVRDTGVGIPKEYLNRIFDAFFTTKGKVSGVGLGLSVSYGIVSQHRGSIEVESTVGQGSTFTVVLPYEAV